MMKPSWTQSVPVLPIRNTIIFPGGTMPLRVGRRKSVNAVERALEQGAWILLVSQIEDVGDSEEGPKLEQLRKVGVLASIVRTKGNPREGYQVVVRCTERYRVDRFEEEKGTVLAHGEVLETRRDTDEKTLAALEESIRTLAGEILSLLPGNTQRLRNLLDEVRDLSLLVDVCASNIEITDDQKIELLEMASLRDRALRVLEHLQKQKQALEVRGEIREKLSSKLGKAQRDALLREQLRTIREELGEEDEAADQDDLRRRIEEASLPEEARKQALSELKRLESLGAGSPESHVIRTYLDWLVVLPWARSSPSDLGALDLVEARRRLDADHFGLDTVKRRIIQHLAVMKLRGNSARGSILLLVGPPGVGKTSLGQSIAQVLGRKFIRAALGGVRDESEVRGHRRTYVGALPGRVIQSLKRAGENDPVMLLDEIDKLGRGWSGDPSSALLEVLDPEQNSTFVDHYLDVPFDLSKVFFIATANSLDGIPGPLLDRMEVIQLSGYTVEEKLHIAQRHLVPKQLAEHGLRPEDIEFSDEMLRKMILAYTRESGVRELQRRVAGVCRVVAERLLMRAESDSARVRVDSELLEDAFGQERYQSEALSPQVPPGVVTGLAWTPAGGEILFVEASQVAGSGKLTLTGQLGDVMKESAQIAVSLVRRLLGAEMRDPELTRTDLHIHLPSGAIPKDGPSAGVTLTTAIASLMLGRPVDPTLAMTGEITLRGAVTPVGGIKEKLLAAHRAGVKKVLLSRRNERDLKELPAEVREGLQVVWVDDVGDVLREALGYEGALLLRGPGLDRSGPLSSPGAVATL